MKRSSVIIAGLAIAIFLISCMIPLPADAQLSKKYELTWGTIVAGGAWQILGSAMLEDIRKANPNITGANVPSTPTATLMAIHQGKFDMGFSLTDATAEAWDGEGYFKSMGQVRNIRSLVTLYPQATHLVVRADSDIKRVEDLRGKRVSPAARGLSNDIEAQRLFKLYGMSYNDMKVQFLRFEDAAVRFIDGHLDALLYLTLPFPFASVINVNSHRQVRLISLPDDKIAQLAKFRGVEAYTLPGGLYKGIDYPVKGIAVRAHLVVSESMPDELAYSIVKAIGQNYSRYPSVLKPMEYARPDEMEKDVGIPLHPGALKYYKERGLAGVNSNH